MARRLPPCVCGHLRGIHRSKVTPSQPLRYGSCFHCPCPKFREAWPEAVSDGLVTACADCGQHPRFDYIVSDDFWRRWVPGPEHSGVVCLPCLDRRSGGLGLAGALTEVQWTGTSHTVVLRPAFRHEYADTRGAG